MPLPIDDLLKRLGSGVRPASGESAPRVSHHTDPQAVGARRFDSLLIAARTGDIDTERPVAIDASIDRPVDAAMLRWFGRVLDAAEANNAGRVAAIVGDHCFVLDAEQRTISSCTSIAGAASLQLDIDGLAILESSPDADAASDADPDAEQRAAQRLHAAAVYAASKPITTRSTHQSAPGTPRADGSYPTIGLRLTNGSLAGLLADTDARRT